MNGEQEETPIQQAKLEENEDGYSGFQAITNFCLCPGKIPL